jgi:hypothetical protein
MKNAVVWEVTPCGPCKNRRFGGRNASIISNKNRGARSNFSSFFFFLRSVLRLLVTANVVSSSLILVALMTVAISSPEMSVLTIAMRRNIPQYDILPRHRSENLKSYALSLYVFQLLRIY